MTFFTGAGFKVSSSGGTDCHATRASTQQSIINSAFAAGQDAGSSQVNDAALARQKSSDEGTPETANPCLLLRGGIHFIGLSVLSTNAIHQNLLGGLSMSLSACTTTTTTNVMQNLLGGLSVSWSACTTTTAITVMAERQQQQQQRGLKLRTFLAATVPVAIDSVEPFPFTKTRSL